MKKCYFRSFDVGIGDCNVIRIVDGDKQYSIMVDCGRFTTPVKDGKAKYGKMAGRRDISNYID